MFAGAVAPKGAANLGPMSAHLASIERQTGKRPQMADPVGTVDDTDCPDVLRYLWDWFLELLPRRSGGALGPNPLSYAEVLAWAQLMERDVTPREVRLLLLFSEVDWGWDYLHAVMGPQVREWEQQGNPRLATVKRADHMMTPLVSQDRTQNLVLDWASRLPTREEFVL